MFTGKAVAYWRKGLRTQNFGDLLSELLFRELTGRSLLNPFTGRRVAPFDTIHLLGSVISNYHVTADLEHGRGFGAQKIAFWCCGKRDGSTLDEELLEHCVFLGARGPLTRDALHLPAETPLGDPALLLPAIYRPHIDRNLADKTLCVPHFLEKKPDSQLLVETGADMIVRPNIPASIEAIYKIIDQIVSARFVLCGALHAAIVCCAYNSAFSYFDSGYVDAPFKWCDFSASIDIEEHFPGTVLEGERLYGARIHGRIRKPNLERILDCAPYTPPRALQVRLRSYQKAERGRTRTHGPH